MRLIVFIVSLFMLCMGFTVMYEYGVSNIPAAIALGGIMGVLATVFLDDEAWLA